MANIETRAEMLRAGYKFRNNSVCKGCAQPIEWWTTTNKKLMPYDPMPESDAAKVSPHWATCPKRDQFKSKADVKLDTAEARTKAVAELLGRTGARAIIALYAEGPVLAWASGIPGDEFRDEGIAAANKLRWQVQLGRETQV